MKFLWLKKLLGISEPTPETYIRVEVADKAKIEQIKVAVGLAETGRAIDLLHTLSISAIEKEVIALSGRHQSLQDDQRRGLLSNEDYRLQTNRLHHDLLALVTTLEKSLEPEKIIREIKENLRKRYQNRFYDKLADRQPINIQCAYSIEGTALERAQIAYDEIVLAQETVQSNLEHLFDRHRGRLLIIGDPGSGKTSLLLQLADALLRRRESRVPVILNLSTWKATHKTLHQWLLETVPSAAAVSRAMAKSLVLEDRLLPLFDGLDEVPTEHRNACLEAIAQYGRVADHQYVICSRTAEYTETVGAPVYGQIKLLPLTQEQIVQHLEKSDQPEARFLLHALRQQPVLARVVENPFYFNTTQLLLSSMKSMADLEIRAETEEQMKAELVEKFVAQQLDTPVRVEFPVEKSRKWLGFLAKKMEENGLVVFELVDLRLGWLEKSKWMYYVGGIFIIYFIMLLYNIFGINSWSINQNIIAGLIVSIVWLLFSSNNFKTVDRLMWSWKNINKQLKNELYPYFLIGFVGALLIIAIPKGNIYTKNILVVFLVFLMGKNSITISISIILSVILLSIPDPNMNTSTSSSNDEPIGVIPFIILSFCSHILSSGFSAKNSIKINKPYRRILITSIYNLFPFILFTAIVIFIILKSIIGNKNYTIEYTVDVFKLITTLILFTLFFKHFLLRIILLFQTHLPLRLATFLREMDARHLFESDGGSWRFRHKILQDYFVQQYKERK